MTPAERVAERTWYTLDRANQLRVRFGEESLTDLLLLDMVPHQHTRGFLVVPPTKADEGRCGADLLVAVRHQTGGWSLYALQAKKLYPEDKYRMLNRVTESRIQLGKLDCFARQLRALPLYLLYNHTNTLEPSEHWHCCRQPCAERQLGCTLVPSWHVWRMLRPRHHRGFDSAHKVSQSRPWRCAFDCPSAEKELAQMGFRTLDDDPESSPVRQYDWPFDEPIEVPWLERMLHTSRTQLSWEDVDRLQSELPGFDSQVTEDARFDEERLYPSRLLLFDQSRDSSVRSNEPQPTNAG